MLSSGRSARDSAKPMDVDQNLLRYSGRTIVLRAPASQSLELPGTAEKIQTWLPEDKEALSIEVRARIVATSSPNTEIPIVRYFIELGHGDSVWRDPTPFQRPAGLEVEHFSLPGRGIAFLVNARQLRLGFRSDGAVSGAAVASNVVQVSMLPAFTSGEHRSVYAASVFGPVDTVQAVPMTAREWRVTNELGLQVPGGMGAAMAELIAVSGAPIGAETQNDFGEEWRPIPHEAAAYRFTLTGAYANFR